VCRTWVAGTAVDQVAVGSCTIVYADLMAVAKSEGTQGAPRVNLVVSPGSKQMYDDCATAPAN
jgi:homoaconitase/3-isopropylmalate dehydratase large subunit